MSCRVGDGRTIEEVIALTIQKKCANCLSNLHILLEI